LTCIKIQGGPKGGITPIISYQIDPIVVIAPKLLFPSVSGSSSKVFCAGEDRDCRRRFRDESVVQTQRQCRSRFLGINASNRLTIKRLQDKFKETGSVPDNTKGPSGQWPHIIHGQSEQKTTS